MRGFAVVVVAGTIFAAAVACGSFGADETKTDAGATSSSSSSSSSSTSSSSGADGGGEAGPSVGDLCTGASYCDGFERDSAERTDGAEASLNFFADSADIIPGGHTGKAIRFKVGAGNPNNHVRFELVRNVATSLKLSFWVRLNAPLAPTNEHINLADFVPVDVEPAVNVVAIAVDSRAGLVIEDNSREYEGVPPDHALPLNVWAQVVLEMNVGAKTAALTIDDHPSVTTVLDFDSKSDAMKIYIGPRYSTVNPFEIDYDDVRLDVQ